MGIYIDYTLCAECSEEELLGRLNVLREGVLKLPVERVSEVMRIDPVCNPLLIRLLRTRELRIPPVVEERIEGLLEQPGYSESSLEMSLDLFSNLSREMKDRYYQPALEFIRTSDLWDEDDYPEELQEGWALTYYRNAIFLEFASILLRYGFVMYVDPGEGSETVNISLSTYRSPGTPLWAGGSFTKTQYATEFVKVHETVCRIVDLLGEVGLLYKASDNTGFYEHRDWSRSADRVNEETTFAWAVSKMLTIGAESARRQGVNVEILSAPALKSFNLIRTDGSDTSTGKQDPPGDDTASPPEP